MSGGPGDEDLAEALNAALRRCDDLQLALVALEGRLAEKRATEDRLQLFRAALDSTRDALLISDPTGVPLYLNASCRELLRLQDDPAWTGAHPLSAFSDPARARRTLREVDERGTWEGIAEMSGPGGQRRVTAIRVDAVRDGDGPPVALVGLLTDVTRDRLRAEALGDQKRRLALLHDIAREVNTAEDLREALGTALARARDLLLAEAVSLVPLDARVPGLAIGAVGSEGGPCLTARVDHRDEALAELVARRGSGALPFSQEDEGLLRTLAGIAAGAVAHAIRVRELGDARARAEAASRAKTEFLANMSHEVRTPLHGILGMAELLDGTELDAVQRDWLTAVRGSGEALLAVLDGVLDLSRVEAGRIDLELAPFDPRSVLEETAALHAGTARTRGIELRWSAEGLPDRARGDAHRLAQVLGNLVGNAIKFTERGHVEVRARGAEEGGRARLRFDVEDTGIGVDPARSGSIFEAFAQGDASTTRRFGGSGLGLTLARHLARLMGGDVVLAASSPAGSTFRAEVVVDVLPADTRGAGPEPAVGAASRPTAGVPARVLVVEDSALNQRVAVEMLGRIGCRVRVAADGPRALALVAAELPDLVLLDVQMPGMDGLEVARRLRADPATAGVPIVAMTAHAFAEARLGCLRAGMDDVVTKPVGAAELARVVERWTARGPSLSPVRLAELGEHGIVGELVEILLREAPERLAALREAVERGDVPEVGAVAHALKGAAANLGAADLRAAAQAVERAARRGDGAALSELVARAERAWARSERQLRALAGAGG